MGLDTIREALGQLQVDADDGSAWELLELLSKEDELATLDRASLSKLLQAAREAHARRGEWEAVERLLPIEVAVATNVATKLALLAEHARVLQAEMFDESAANRAYERLLEAAPEDELAKAALAESSERRGSWREMADTYRAEADQAPDDVYKASMLMRAAEVELRFGPNGEADVERVLSLLAQANEADPRNLSVLSMLERIYRRTGRYQALPAVLQRWIKNAGDPETKIAAGLRLARLMLHRQGDPDGCAEAYESILDIDPTQPEAVGWLVDHYSSSENWDRLVHLYERELQQHDLGRSERVGDMLQIAMLHFRKRNNLADAAVWFDRIRAVEASNPAMLGFFREYCSVNGDEALLLQVLQGAQRVLPAGPEKSAITQEIARLAESQEDAQKAIEQYKALLRQDADNEEARAALKALYRKTQGYNQLVDLLRHELERLAEDDRNHRLGILREVAGIYREHIPNETSLVSALNQILQVDDKDVGAVRELITLYEKLERWRDLLTQQQRLAALSDDVEERVRLLRASGRRWLQQFNNVQNATTAFESLIELSPLDREARDTLADLYKKRRAWPALYNLYKTEVETLSGAQQAAVLKEMAKLAGERLGDAQTAAELHKRILEAEPDNLAILDALEKQAERSKDWVTLADALERRARAGVDPKTQIAVLQKLGTVYEDHLGDSARAAGAWRRILELEPGHARAVRTLRDLFLASEQFDALDALYSSQSDFEGLADVLSGAADRATDIRSKVDLSYRAAAVYEDRLGQPQRAFRSYERILSADPMDTRAARALAPLYEADEKWARLPALYELLLSDTHDAHDKITLYRRLIEITARRLSDRAAAVGYARKAYEVDPAGLETLELFEHTCSDAGTWEPFVETIEARLSAHRDAGAVPSSPQQPKKRRGRAQKKSSDPPVQAAVAANALPPDVVARLESKLAWVYDNQLKRADDAVRVYRRLLEANPEDLAAFQQCEALLRRENRRDDLRWLYGLRVEHEASDEGALALMRQWAELEEGVFGDVARAADLYRRILERSSADPVALRELPRLLLVLGEAAAAVEVLLQLRDTLEGAERAKVEASLAEVYLERLNQPEEALSAAVRTVQLEHEIARAVEVLQRLSHVPKTQHAAAEMLAEVYHKSGENRREADALVALLGAEKDASRRLDLYRRIVDVHEQLGSFSSAFDAIVKACHEFPSELDLWDRANVLCAQAGRPSELAEVYRDVLQADLPKEMQLQLCERAATLVEEQLGDPGGATPYLEKVLKLDPGNQEAFSKLKQILTSSQRWGELQALYDRTAQAVEDPEMRVEILGEVAMVCEEFIEDFASAMAYYEKMLEVVPDQEGALAALDRLYSEHKKYAELERILETRLSVARGGDEAAELRLRLARLELDHLHRPEKALKNVEDLLLQDPNDAAARELGERILEIGTLQGDAAVVLERVYEARDDIRDLARVLEVRVGVQREVEDGASELKELLRRLATLKNERLRDDVGTRAALSEYVPLAPEDADARGLLLTVCSRLGSYKEAASVLMKAAEKADSPRLAGEILLSAARILDQHLSQPDAAEQAYRRVIEVGADDPDLVIPAAQSLERLYQTAGRFDALVGALRTQLELQADGDERSSLLGRIALLSEERLGNVGDAIDAWKTRMKYAPDDEQALVALDRLYEKAERWQDLWRIVELRRDHSSDAALRRELYRKSSRLLAGKLDNLAGAIDSCRACMDEFGPDVEGLVELEGYLRQAERFDELGEALESHLQLAASTEERLDLFTALGNLRANRLGNASGALEAFREVVATNPGHVEARAALERMLESEEPFVRVEAAETLQAVYEGEGSNEKLLGVLEILARASDDPVARLDVLNRAIRVVDGALGDPRRGFDLAVRALKEAAGHVDITPSLDELERLAKVTGRRAEQVEALRGVVDAIFDEDVQYRVLQNIAVLARDELADRALALSYFKRSSEVRPDADEALAALEALYAESGDNEALLEVLERRTELCTEDEGKKELLLRRAALLEGKLHAPERAAQVYERVLEFGLDERPIKALVELYSREKRWHDLVDLHQRRLDSRESDEASLRVAIARVCADHLGDQHRAFDELEEALKVRPSVPDAIAELERLMKAPGAPEHHARAATLLEPFYLARSDFGQVLATLKARLEYAHGDERRELLQRLAKLYEEQQEDYASALETVADLFAVDATDVTVRAELERLAKVSDAPARLAAIYAGELEKLDTDDESTSFMARRAGELHVQLGNLETALGFYRRALKFEPDNRELFTAEDAILERLSRHEERVTLYRTALDHYFEPEDRLRLLHTIAKLQTDQLQQKDKAIATYVEALEIKDDDPIALDTLSRLYYETSRFEDLYELVLRRAEAVNNPTQAVAYRLALARLCRDELRDSTRAIEQLETIVEVDPRHKEAIEELEAFRKNPEQRQRVVDILLPLYQQADEWRRVIKLNEDRFQLASDTVEKVHVLRETAELWERRGNDPRRACQGLAAAVNLEPDDDEVRAEYERLVETIGAWDALAQLYQNILDQRKDLTRAGELWSKLARTHDGPRNDPRAALDAYAKLREIDDTELEPVERMESLATLLSDWETLDEVLLAKADLVHGEEERASIWRRIGEGRRDMLGRVDGAIEAYERALEVEPDSAFTMDCLIELYEQQKKWRELVDMYQRRIDVLGADDTDMRYELLLAAASSHEQHFQDRIRAIDLLSQALETKPNDVSVLQRLNALYRAEAQWPELLENLRTQANVAESAEARAAFNRDMGDLLSSKLENFPDALEAYQLVLQDVPGDLGARSAVRNIGQQHEELRQDVATILLPALQEARAFEEVVEILELRLTVESDQVDRAQTLRAMARVLESDVGDLGRAHAMLLRAMAEVPEDASVHAEIERLCEGAAATTRWGAYADALTERAQTTFDADLAKELYSRLGQIAEQRLRDPERAVHAYTKAVDQVGDQPEILQALDRLFTSLGKWAELTDILDRLAPLVDSDAERAELHYRSALVQIDRFSEAGQGLAELRAAVELDARHEGARSKLEELVLRRDLFDEAAEILESVYRSSGAMDKLTRLSERRVEFAETAGERIEMRKALARVLEDEMRDPAGAQRVLQQGLKDDPSDSGLLDEIERLAEATGDWSGAGKALAAAIEDSETIPALVGKDLCLRLAGWFGERAGDADSAEVALTKAFAFDETADDVLQRLERLQSVPGKELARIQTLRKRSELAFDEVERENLAREAHDLAEAKGESQIAEKILRDLLAHDDANRWALGKLCDLVAKKGDHEETYSLLLRLAEVSLDATELSELRHRAAHLAKDELREKPKAVELYERLFQDDPLDVKAADALRQLYAETGSFDELVQLLDRLTEIVDSPSERSALRIELARMQLEHYKATDRAAELLHLVLEEEPGNSEAVVALSRLYEAEGRDSELAELLSSQIAAAGERGDRQAVLTFEVRLADVYDTKLGDKKRATEIYARVLEEEPKHRGALESLVRLFRQQGDLPRAADTLATIVELSEGAERLAKLKELAAAYVELGDAEKAMKCLEIALGQDHRDAEVRDRLRTLYRDHGAWERLGELLAADAGHTSDEVQQVALLREAAMLFSQKLENAGRASQLLEKAVEKKPDDRGLLMALCDEYNKGGRGRDAVSVLEKIVVSFGGRRSKELADVHRRLAAAYRSDGNTARAVEELEKAFRIEPGNVTVLKDLGALSLEGGDLSRAQQMYRALLLQKLDKSSPIQKHEVFYSLALVHQRLDEKPKAVQMLERAVQAEPGFAEAEKLLAELRG